MIKILSVLLSAVFILSTVFTSAFAWHDETHLAIAKAAGYSKWYNCASADLAKEKAGNIEDYNHWYNNKKQLEITTEIVRDQIRKYNNPNDPEGHLYGAIVASLQEYDDVIKNRSDKYAEYNIAFFCHYVGDLSQPFHNMEYDKFNWSHHKTNDGIVESKKLDEIVRMIKERMTKNVVLRPDHFEADLINEIVRIANKTRNLGMKLRKENEEKLEKGDMTIMEAYEQLALSADLLKAVISRKNKSLLLMSDE